MKDFKERFAAIFERVCNFICKGAIVKATVVENRYPINEETARISTRPHPKEHPSFKKKSFVVIEIFYPKDYPRNELSDTCASPLACEITTSMYALGLGELLHNTNGREDAYIIFTPICKSIYEHLPPAEQWNGKS